MKVLIFLTLVALVTAFDYADEWEAWKKEHSKLYKDDVEESRRQAIWQANKDFVEAHNSDADKFGYTLGMNEFADLENKEFVQLYNGYKMQERSNTTEMFVPDPNFELKPEDTVDWREKGAVTGIKNQGRCASCWAFSTTGSLEGQHFLKAGQLVSLSESNLVDCSRSYGNNGCKGGVMDNAFRYIEAYGIDTEQSYPYNARDGACRYNSSNVGATCTGYVDVPHGDEMALMEACSSVGPISVAMDANHRSIQTYKSGVYFEPECSSTRLDHGVLVVG